MIAISITEIALGLLWMFVALVGAAITIGAMMALLSRWLEGGR